MIERAHARFGLPPGRLAANAGYGDAPNLAWLVEKRGIAPHIPVFDRSARTDGTFERSAFTFDPQDDSYACPGGKHLRPRNRNFSVPRSNVDIWPMGTRRERAMFEKLKDAYVKARYSKHCRISEEELRWLGESRSRRWAAPSTRSAATASPGSRRRQN